MPEDEEYRKKLTFEDTAMRWCSLWCVAALLLALASCVCIPYRASGHREMGETTLDFLKEGVTTREEVLLTLGHPDRVRDGNRLFLYWWDEIRGMVAYSIPYIAGSMYEAGPRHGLRIEFDDNGKVQNFTLEEPGFPSGRHSKDFYPDPDELSLYQIHPCLSSH